MAGELQGMADAVSQVRSFHADAVGLNAWSHWLN